MGDLKVFLMLRHNCGITLCQFIDVILPRHKNVSFSLSEPFKINIKKEEQMIFGKSNRCRTEGFPLRYCSTMTCTLSRQTDYINAEYSMSQSMTIF